MNQPFEKRKGKTDEWYTPLERVKTIEKYIPKGITVWCPLDPEQSYYVKQLGGGKDNNPLPHRRRKRLLPNQR